MVELAIADNPLFQLCRLELERAGPSYIIETLRALRRDMGDQAELVFLTGTDALSELHDWHRPEALLAEFEIAFVDRLTEKDVDWPAVEARLPGIRERAQIVRVPRLEISARELRRRVRTGRPIRYYVLPAVEGYIHDRGLYRNAGPADTR
jgi:nicotinate-nucleotide adenylyltransferase